MFSKISEGSIGPEFYLMEQCIPGAMDGVGGVWTIWNLLRHLPACEAWANQQTMSYDHDLLQEPLYVYVSESYFALAMTKSSWICSMVRFIR